MLFDGGIGEAFHQVKPEDNFNPGERGSTEVEFDECAMAPFPACVAYDSAMIASPQFRIIIPRVLLLSPSC